MLCNQVLGVMCFNTHQPRVYWGTQMPWNLLGTAKGSCTRASSVQLAASITSTKDAPAASTQGASTTPSSSAEAPGRATNTGSPATAAAEHSQGSAINTAQSTQVKGCWMVAVIISTASTQKKWCSPVCSCPVWQDSRRFSMTCSA
eukprot:GHRQ01021720.1.p1 GENE.GHRQ01021720.1~~GHRQ01021720.1.p1  ORF type:complete len:146 (+),score=27.11 GHRQ01021720.1:245-682(+)